MMICEKIKIVKLNFRAIDLKSRPGPKWNGVKGMGVVYRTKPKCERCRAPGALCGNWYPMVYGRKCLRITDQALSFFLKAIEAFAGLVEGR